METREGEMIHESVRDITAVVGRGGKEGGREERREGGKEGVCICSSMFSSSYHSFYTL